MFRLEKSVHYEFPLFEESMSSKYRIHSKSLYDETTFIAAVWATRKNKKLGPSVRRPLPFDLKAGSFAAHTSIQTATQQQKMNGIQASTAPANKFLKSPLTAGIVGCPFS